MNSYQHYLDNLAGKKPPIHDGQPQPGFYKRRFVKGGPWVAGAIWDDALGQILCRVGNQMRDAIQEWTWLAKHPVPEADALHYFQHGRWPEVHPATPAPAAASVGHNQPPETAMDEAKPVAEPEPPLPTDPYLNLVARIERALKAAAAWVTRGAIQTKEQADAAGDKLGDLRKVLAEAKKRHETEKAPHLAEGRRIDDLYLPWVKEIEPIGKRLRKLLEAFADKIAAETLQRQRLAEEAQTQLAANGHAPAAPLSQEPTPKIQFGALGHRKVGFRTVPHVEFTDRAKIWRKYKNDSRVVAAIDAVLLELAQEAVERGERVPGVTVTERRIAA